MGPGYQPSPGCAQLTTIIQPSLLVDKAVLIRCLRSDPRWGRNQETPGECPYLSGEYAMQYVRGMQLGMPGSKHYRPVRNFDWNLGRSDGYFARFWHI